MPGRCTKTPAATGNNPTAVGRLVLGENNNPNNLLFLKMLEANYQREDFFLVNNSGTEGYE